MPKEDTLEASLPLDGKTLALKDMNYNESLGNDEFPGEFYKRCKDKDILLPQLLNVHNDSKKQGAPQTTLHEVIFL